MEHVTEGPDLECGEAGNSEGRSPEKVSVGADPKGGAVKWKKRNEECIRKI